MLVVMAAVQIVVIVPAAVDSLSKICFKLVFFFCQRQHRAAVLNISTAVIWQLANHSCADIHYNSTPA